MLIFQNNLKEFMMIGSEINYNPHITKIFNTKNFKQFFFRWNLCSQVNCSNLKTVVLFSCFICNLFRIIIM